MLEFGLFESFQGERGRGAEVGASARDNLGIELVDRLEDGLVIDSERRLDEGTSGKGDQPDSVLGEGEDDVLRRELGAGEAIRREVIGHHAARGIDRDDEIARVSLGFDLGEAEDGTCQRDEGRGEGEAVEREDDPAAAVTAAADEATGEAGRDESGELAGGVPVRPRAERDERHEDKKSPEPDGLGKGESVHG